MDADLQPQEENSGQLELTQKLQALVERGAFTSEALVQVVVAAWNSGASAWGTAVFAALLALKLDVDDFDPAFIVIFIPLFVAVAINIVWGSIEKMVSDDLAKTTSCCKGIAIVLMVTLFSSPLIAFYLLTALKLDDDLSWSWYGVFIPVYASNLLMFGFTLYLLGMGVMMLCDNEFGDDFGPRAPYLAFFNSTCVSIITLSFIAFSVLLPMFLEGDLGKDATIWTAFIPLFIKGGTMVLLSLVNLAFRNSFMVIESDSEDSEDFEDDQAFAMIVKAITYANVVALITGLFLLLLTVLIALFVEGDIDHLYLVFIPLFVVLLPQMCISPVRIVRKTPPFIIAWRATVLARKLVLQNLPQDQGSDLYSDPLRY